MADEELYKAGVTIAPVNVGPNIRNGNRVFNNMLI
jgi:hypothetical protein